MFVKEKPKKVPLPSGAKESWVVRYPGGRKPFETNKEAMEFARNARAEEKGWAEVSHLVERVVSPR